ncbi:hypothetical protein VOLCADRAFT_99300 [Volvox carteri f. nagariensis]|uniref:Uncharacterized protein n=1 Tax=Volvox carteri f. nagariensis TaxID=3068 RepID=D8UHG5_VOLCA|nr:uncharacterized protein VOLCADRAFT_99300 [Volvox carteri f. nagariensis]EFJ40848.1 hypothetical protein VOLCADRAFT_99300 [Volvox carteri f. nagariensis]|eukprot:XP_002958117.1 hypothetical protein VOLCADRAFT_99300 [Volvox carteri f. nagariensis]
MKPALSVSELSQRLNLKCWSPNWNLRYRVQLLEAIPRARTVRELREVQQHGQAQGYFTTAHSVATIMQLGTLAATTPLSPGERDAARQLATQLLRRLRRPQQQNLPPALRVHTERAALQLGLDLDLLSSEAPHQQHQQHLHHHQVASSTAPTHATPHPPPSLSTQSRGPPDAPPDAPASAPGGTAGGGNTSGSRGLGQEAGGQGGGAATGMGMGDGQVSAAGAASPVVGEAASLKFHEALHVAWKAWRGSSSGDWSAEAEVAGDPTWRDEVEAALQGAPPGEMAIGDLAEAVHLMVGLRLMPKYDWLCAVQDRLRLEMAAVEGEVAAGRVGGGGSGSGELGQGSAAALVGAYADGAAAMLADLRQVYEATEELMQFSGSSTSSFISSSGNNAVTSTGGNSPCSQQGEHAAAAAAAHAMVPNAASVAPPPSEPSPSPHRNYAQQGKEEPHRAVPPLEDTRGGLTRGTEPSTGFGGLEDLGRGRTGGQKAAEELPGSGGGEESDEAHDNGGGPAAALGHLRVLLRQAGGERVPAAGGPLAALGSVGDDGRGDSDSTDTNTAARRAVADLTLLLAAAHRAEVAAAGRTATVTAAASAAELSSAAECSAPGLTAEHVAALVAAARAVQPAGLPSQLLAAAARLLVATSRSGVTCVHVALVLAACVETGYTPPPHLLEQLVTLAFKTQSPLPLDDKKQLPSDATRDGAAAATPAAVAAAAAAAAGHEQQPVLGAELSASYIRALHECGVAQRRLGYRLNNRQFGNWVDAVTRRPLALSPPQLVQLMTACTERGYAVRPAEVASGLIAAAIQPPARLQRLSGSEAVAVVQFAVQQGLQLGADGSSSSSSTGGGGAAPPALLQHLAPKRLQELTATELGVLLPALCAAGAVLGRTGGSAAATAATTTWLADHSSALLPHAEALQPEEVLRLLRCYDQLDYSPPSLLLLGFSLALESQLASAPLLTLLQALHLLLCGRRSFKPNEGLAAAIHEHLLPRLMLAATATMAPPPPLLQQQLEGSGGMTMPQRLMVLQVLAAARVRPHPAQLAAVLEVEMSGGAGLMAGLAGDELVALLWHCVAFRALPSWRFIGEWLEAFAAAAGSRAAAERSEAHDGSAAAAGASIGSQVSAGALARVGWCLAQMGLQPDAGWQAAYQAALLPVLPRLDGEALSLVAHSSLLLRSRPSEEWLEALIRAALGRLEELDGASATRLLHFIAAADVQTSQDWIQSFFLHTLHLLEGPAVPEPQPLAPVGGAAAATAAGRAAAAASGPAASSDQIALMLRALARLGFRPPEAWLAAALQRLCTGALALSPACFPVVLMSLVRLCPDLVSEAEPGGVVDQLVRAAYKKRGAFTALELCWLLEALGCYPAYELPAAAAENLMAALRRLEEGPGEIETEAEGSGDVALALGGDVSGSWLAW